MSSNPIFAFEGIRTATLTASHGSEAGYPTTNLQDDRYYTQWMSASDAINQLLTIDFGSGITRAMDYVLIANHNFASLGLRYLTFSVKAYLGSWEDQVVLDPGLITDPLLVSFPASIARRYLGIYFDKEGGSELNEAPELGMVLTGTKATMSLYSNNPERGLQSDAVVSESMSKLRYSSSMGADREAWKLDFSKLTTTQLYHFMRLIRAVNGMQYPFWFCDMDGNWHFVRFKKDYLPLIGKGNVAFQAKGIEFDEERVGIAMNLPGGNTVPAAE